MIDYKGFSGTSVDLINLEKYHLVFSDGRINHEDFMVQ